MVRWTKLRVLATILALGFACGVLFDVARSAKLFSRQPVPNVVYHNDQRLPPLAALEQLRTAFPSNFATELVGIAAAVLIAILYFALLAKLYHGAPLRTLLAGLFLGGSVLAVVLQAMTILRVSEFGFQTTIATPEERRWLEGGVTFLNQLHLIFVHSWFLLTGLGSIFLGLASFGHSRWRTWAGAVTVGGGVAVVSGEVLRAWFPKLGETVPMALALGDSMLFGDGMGLVGLGAALLLWSVSAPVRIADAQPATAANERQAGQPDES
jgi:hypothetical protein